MSDRTGGEKLSADTDPLTSWAIVISVFLLGGIGSTLLITDSNLVTFTIVGCLVAFPVWVVFTESGAEWWVKEVMDSNSQELKQSSDTMKSRSNIICQTCGWQNNHENNYCHDCGAELESLSSRNDSSETSAGTNSNDSISESEILSTETGTEDNANTDDVNNSGVDKDGAEAIAVLGSICVGGLVGVWLLFNGNSMLAGGTFLVAVGWPFLLTRHGRESMRRWLGMSRNPKYNESSSSTKECPECGWHNHQANNNCVECDAGFE